jgi:hypothetical protein
MQSGEYSGSPSSGMSESRILKPHERPSQRAVAVPEVNWDQAVAELEG